MLQQIPENYRVVIVGGGFAGVNTARGLRNSSARVMLIDRQDFFVFLPLLYQVATGLLTPEDVLYRLRAMFAGDENVTVLRGEVIDFDPARQRVILSDGEVAYDTLVVAAGLETHHFGNEGWANTAPGLKTMQEAIEIRRRVRMAFAAARRETDLAKRREQLTFVVVGGGPTGVELAGSIIEAAYLESLRKEASYIDAAQTRVILLEMQDRLLPSYAPQLSQQTQATLENIGVTVRLNTKLVSLDDDKLVVQAVDGNPEHLIAPTVIWAAGLKASFLGQALARSTGVDLDPQGRVLVNADLSIPGYKNIFVIGDLANYTHQSAEPLPPLVPVARQQGQYVARMIKNQFNPFYQFFLGNYRPDFQYFDLGKMAVVSRDQAVIDFGGWGLSGQLVWMLWVFIHLYFLTGADNTFSVMAQWSRNYIAYHYPETQPYLDKLFGRQPGDRWPGRFVDAQSGQLP